MTEHRLVKVTWPAYSVGWPLEEFPLRSIHRAWCSCGADCTLETGQWGDWLRGHQMFPDAFPAELAGVLEDAR